MRNPFRDHRFEDRVEAGRRLAARLARYRGRSDAVVLALPRGGVPVGCEIARSLELPLDVLIVRKLGHPSHPELALGAIASGGARVIDLQLVQRLGLTMEELGEVEESERRELARRQRSYRGERPPLDLGGRTVIVVDDGAATGATLTVALRALRTRAPARLIVALPVAPREVCERLRYLADEVVCLETPEPFVAVSVWYRDFPQLGDEEVRRTLRAAGAGGRPREDAENGAEPR